MRPSRANEGKSLVKLSCALVALAVLHEPRAEAATPRVNQPKTSRPIGSIDATLSFDPARWPQPACSPVRPICAYANAATSPAERLRVLHAAERIWAVLTESMDLPPPDLENGSAHPFVIASDLDEPAKSVVGVRDPRAAFDRASAVSYIATGLDGCTLDRAIAEALVRGSIARKAPATDQGSQRAQAAHLATIATGCAPDPAALIDFQSHPEKAIVDLWPDNANEVGARFTRGAEMFYAWLESRFSTEPGFLLRGTWALAATKSPSPVDGWNNEPDVFDVLRMSMRERLAAQSTVDDVWLSFAIARALAAVGDPEERLAAIQSYGTLAPPYVEWDLPSLDRPRRLASSRPLAPGGAVFIRVRGGSRPSGSTIRLEAVWEQHARMRWAALKLDGQGYERAKFLLPAVERGTETQMTLSNVEDAELLIVGVNVGDYTPFDPDDRVWEPHGWLLTLDPL